MDELVQTFLDQIATLPSNPSMSEYVVPWTGHAILFDSVDFRRMPEPTHISRDEPYFLFEWTEDIHCALIPWKNVCIYDYRPGHTPYYYDSDYGNGIATLVSLVAGWKQ